MAHPVPWLRLLVCLLIGACASAQILAMLHFGGGANGVTLKVDPYTPLLTFTYLIFMLPTALLIGLPGYLILRKLNRLNGYSVVTAGTLTGAAWVLPTIGSRPPSYLLALFFALGGFLASSVFWLAFSFRNKTLAPDSGEKSIDRES